MRSELQQRAVPESSPAVLQVLRDEKVMLDKLFGKLEEIEAEFTTTLEQDKALKAAGGLTPWHQVAVDYRIERKALARAARKVLDIYDDIIQCA
jgi:hypothetical protein